MDKISKSIVWIQLLVFSLFISCSEDTVNTEPVIGDLIRNFSLSSPVEIYVGQSIIVNGVGYDSGDILNFKSVSNEFEVIVTTVSEKSCSFIVPDGFVSSSYSVTIKRDNKFQYLGSLVVKLKDVKDVPDKENTTIKGMVFCQGNAVPGVRVTDGIITTETDQNGFYWLNSNKNHGYVYLTLPSGYEVVGSGNEVFPKFWSVLRSDKLVCEQHDFELTPVNNTNHIMLVATDLHLGNRLSVTNDLTQFNNGFINDANKFVYAHDNTPVYTMFLGDLAWDEFWYANNYDLSDYKKTMESYYSTAIFNVMGNHDNDPSKTGDFAGEQAFKDILGPTYYSVNIGGIHYIVLDNTVWVNTNGAEGIVGDLSYNRHIVEAQLNWLKEDLDAISDKNTPVVIGFHCHTHSNYNQSFATTKSITSASTDALLSYLSGFSEVHLLSGHTHYNANIPITSKIMEHNTAAVCETWWWSGKLTGAGICRDGTPSGYGVYEMNGKNVKWYYKSIGKPEDKQFRSYDMNRVKEFYTSNVQNVLEKYSVRNGEGNDYASVEENVVFLNIWNYDPEWEISVTEDGTELSVKRIYERDPFHTLCYDYPRMVFDSYVHNEWTSVKNSHMFQVKAASPNSTLQIKVTDRFGSVYEEAMTRPKDFSVSTD
ncbi:calcineurin-like phosphoesterase family protein [Draconibacterium orientale]|uniref:calcineurin-like phosphoesterase family protein n=1 Tax=Draconibacterium orientale TaxID=1168034 RepID=UPI002ABE448B|nr:calcineurin-like phosphoesterase family protein [Draconibacterium orientale]